MAGSLTDVAGLSVGHWTNEAAATGCTVILCQNGTVAGVDVRGAAPGTRETDLLNPLNLIQHVHAILLTGGSAYGLDAAAGVMKWLEERKIGFPVGVGVVPIVPAAVLFDLGIGSASIRPTADSGYLACQQASKAPVPEGSVGAGTGATVGKLLGPTWAMKSGIGTASRRIGGENEITVGALVAVNAFGDVFDPEQGQIIAGCRNPNGSGFTDTVSRMHMGLENTAFGFPGNTTLAVVATDATLSKVAINKVAQMAHDGLAQSIRPIHTMFDGDTVFALSTGHQLDATADVSVIGTVAAAVLAEAVIRAVTTATGLAGVPAKQDLDLNG
ncbi:MAG: P1 family peptidase [Chloroflexota bacterium]